MAPPVTVTFENQKNGLKMDKQTHERTGRQRHVPRADDCASLVLTNPGEQSLTRGRKLPVSTTLKAEGAQIITSGEATVESPFGVHRRGEESVPSVTARARSARDQSGQEPPWVSS